MGPGKFVRAAVAALLAGGALAAAAPAAAQASRTWVSGVGDDVNPCSRTAPCKTFAGAISKTASGGEINCLDPGGYGTLTITKAISIVCDYTEGGVAASGTTGMVINAGINDVVLLSGLDIQGFGTGTNGIKFNSGGALHVRKTLIRGFTGFGIAFEPSTNAYFYADDVTLAANGSTSAGGGILVRPVSTGSARLAITNAQLERNGSVGVRLDNSAGTGSGIFATIENADIDGSVDGLVTVSPLANPSLRAMIVDSEVTNSSGFGIRTDGSGVILGVANTTITNNGTGVSAVNGSILGTYQNNRLNSNTSDGSFTVPIAPK
jgi:hypothetical protein